MRKITIIIPTYNRAQIIPRTLDSILVQTYQDWECIVVDDHSQDNTEVVIGEYIAKDSRIKYLVNTQKKGAQGARNTGLLNAKSEWVIFFDSDNTMHPDYLETLAYAIADDVDVIACYSSIVDVEKGDTGRVLKSNCRGNIEDDIFDGTCYVDFNHSMCRKSKVMEIGMLDENVPSMQEWDTHIRLSKVARYTTIEKCLLDYYIGGKDAISSDGRREVRGRLFILEKHIAEWRTRKSVATSYCASIIRLSYRTKNLWFIIKTICRILWLCPFILPYGALRALSKLFKKSKK